MMVVFSGCLEGQFDCGDGICLMQDDVCDSYYDCDNLADERDCGKCPAFSAEVCAYQKLTCIVKWGLVLHIHDCKKVDIWDGSERRISKQNGVIVYILK